MGRFKRHQKKSNKTNTVVATKYPSARQDNVKPPELSDKVRNLLLMSSVKQRSRKKDKEISSLTASLLKSIKKRRLYGLFENEFYVYNDVWADDSVLANRANDRLLRRHNIDVLVGYNFYYHGRICIEWNEPTTILYHFLLGRIILIDTLLHIKDERHYFRKETPIGKTKILEYFAKDEVKNLQKKGYINSYPNELVFVMMFGAIFASVGFLFITLFLLKLFGIFVAIFFAGTVALLTWGD